MENALYRAGKVDDEAGRLGGGSFINVTESWVKEAVRCVGGPSSPACRVGSME